MPGLECVSDGDLRAYLLGELPSRLIAAVTAHLDGCPDCQTVARRLDAVSDPALSALRLAVGPAQPGRPTLPPDDSDRRQDGPADRDAPPAVPGYTVVRELARTNASVVYEARQAAPSRLVALKMLLAGPHAGVGRRARLLAEADAIARLRHPDIVQVYEVGSHGGVPFLSLEYMDGGNLATLLAGAPLSPARAAALLEVLTRAIHHTHEKGVVHRDLKPANVLLTGAGTPKVADFGLARHERPELTATGAVMGTPSYMAPEQAAGQNQAVGPAADVYALGAILYECLTGRPPFRGETDLETLQQTVSSEPVPPRRLRPTVPRDLDTVCLKCLEKEPARRYATALEVAEELARYRRGEPVRARPLGQVSRGWRWCRRKPALALLALALMTAVAAGTLVSSALAWWALNEADTAHAQAKAAEEGGKRLREEREKGERQLYLARMALLRVAWNEGNLARARELLDLTRPRGDGPDCRQFEWYYFDRILHSDRRTFKLPFGVEAVAVSPDGRRVAAGDSFGTVMVWDVASGDELYKFKVPFCAYDLAFSPDGGQLACGQGPAPHTTLGFSGALRQRPAGGGVTIWDLTTGQQLQEIPEFGGAVLAVAFSPDGKRVAGACAPQLTFPAQIRWTRIWMGGQVRVWDAATGVAQLTLAWPACVGVAFSPDGRRLVATDRSRPHAWDFAERREVGIESGDGTPLAFSRDGRWLALGLERELSVTLRDTSDPKNSTRIVHAAAPFGAVFSPNARRIACVSAGGVTVWDMPGADSERYTLRAHTDKATGVGFSEDGAVLVTGGVDGFVRVWDAGLGSDPPLLGGREESLAFSPDGRHFLSRGALIDAATGQVVRDFGAGRSALSRDGRLVAVSSADGAVRVWDAEDPAEKPRFVFTSGKGEAYVLSLSADGERLACAGSEGVKVWDLRTGDALPSSLPRGFGGRAFSPDCRRVAGCDGPVVTLRDLETGEEVCRLEGHGKGHFVTAFAFSPDGRFLSTGISNETIRVWDLGRRCELFAFIAPGSDRRMWMAFSDDGRRLAAACRGSWLDNSNVRVWELETGQEMASFRASSSRWVFPSGLAFSADGRRLATGIERGGTRVWGAAP